MPLMVSRRLLEPGDFEAGKARFEAASPIRMAAGCRGVRRFRGLYFNQLNQSSCRREATNTNPHRPRPITMAARVKYMGRWGMEKLNSTVCWPGGR